MARYTVYLASAPDPRGLDRGARHGVGTTEASDRAAAIGWAKRLLRGRASTGGYDDWPHWYVRREKERP